MRRILLILATVLMAVCASAQVDRREVREGNRKFRGGNFRQAEIDYRKAALKDSLSVAAQYNLASSLYRQEDYAGAAKALETIKDVAPSHPNSADYFYNAGDVALQAENWMPRRITSTLRRNSRTSSRTAEARTIRTTRIRIRIRTRTRISSNSSRTRIRTRTSSNNSSLASRRYPPSRPSRCLMPYRPRRRRPRTK